MSQLLEISGKITGSSSWGLWGCNETSGNFVDVGPSGYTLISRGSPTYNLTGIEGGAVYFDGSNDEGASNVFSPLGTVLPNEWTVGFNVSGAPQVGKTILSFTAGTGIGSLQFLPGATAGVNDDQLRVLVKTAGNSNVILSTFNPTILDNTWHNIVVVGSGGNTVTAYIDGVAQTPVNGTWSSSRPPLTNMCLAGSVGDDASPQLLGLEMAVGFDNVFCARKALTEAEAIDIYNAGNPDTTPPVLLSATISTDGSQLTAVFTEVGSPPLIPASGITGFEITRLSSGVPISSILASGNEIVFIPTEPFRPGQHLLNYSGGNVTDSSSNSLGTITNFVCTNNSQVSTYAEITLLNSVSSRMVPHTVWVTAAENSVPKSGNWRYCSALWNFGDNSNTYIVNPITNSLKRSSVDQNSWACASHTYENTGVYTISLTLMDGDGNFDTDSINVTITPDSRTLKYLYSNASGGGDGSINSPWNSHGAMTSGLTSNTTVYMSGVFSFSGTQSLPTVSNVWFKPVSNDPVIFEWNGNPADTASVFAVPTGAENIFIDGKTNNDYLSRGIVCISSVGKSTTKADNETSFLRSYGNSVKARNCYVSGDINSGGICSLAFYGGTNSVYPSGMTAENCDFGDCNNYLSVFTNASYVNWLGVNAGTAWIEHTQRWLNPEYSKYIAHQWSLFNHKRIIGGSTAANGASAKDCIRFQSVKYATVYDSYICSGVLDFSYHNSSNTGDYGPGYYIQYNRCIIDDSALLLRPECIDTSISNCYIKESPVLTDIATPEAGSAELNSFSFIHNTFVDMTGTFSFIDLSVLTNASHNFTRTNIDVDGNLFCVASGSTGTFLRIDDASLYSIFSSISNNVMTSGLSVYVQAKNMTTQSTTTSYDWSAFASGFPNNSRQTIHSTEIDVLDQHRPDPSTYFIIATGAPFRSDSILSYDLYGNSRPSSGRWYSGAVGALLNILATGTYTNILLMGVG